MLQGSVKTIRPVKCFSRDIGIFKTTLKPVTKTLLTREVFQVRGKPSYRGVIWNFWLIQYSFLVKLCKWEAFIFLLIWVFLDCYSVSPSFPRYKGLIKPYLLWRCCYGSLRYCGKGLTRTQEDHIYSLKLCSDSCRIFITLGYYRLFNRTSKFCLNSWLLRFIGTRLYCSKLC